MPILLRYQTPRLDGPDVVLCQERLALHGFPVKNKGRFRSDTRSAVKKFQKAKGVVVDGVVGPVTWALLLAPAKSEAATTPPAPPPSVALKDALVAACRAELGMVYCWGRMGQTNLTDSQIRSAETSETNALRAIAFANRLRNRGVNPIRYFDCSGLISYFLKRQNFIVAKRNCNHLASMCVKVSVRASGEDIRSKLSPGDLVFRWSASGKYYHVGVYSGNGKVIEAKGRDDGVVERDIDASGPSYWNRYGNLKCLEA